MFFVKSVESIQYKGDSWLNLEMRGWPNAIYRIRASEFDEEEIRWLRSTCNSGSYALGIVQVTWYPNSSERDGNREVHYITSIRLAMDS
ncbi:MAG: hypothetical protein KDD66_14270 [Bdellovibrionales bacterium]|nr:hypothetical protein [Bdellovibrionales bacterium]